LTGWTGCFSGFPDENLKVSIACGELKACFINPIYPVHPVEQFDFFESFLTFPGFKYRHILT
jgi:hypothetical protein